MLGDSHIPVHSCWSPVGESGKGNRCTNTSANKMHVIMLYLQLETFFVILHLNLYFHLVLGGKYKKNLGWWMKYYSGRVDIHRMEIALGLSWYIQVQKHYIKLSVLCCNIYTKMWIYRYTSHITSHCCQSGFFFTREFKVIHTAFQYHISNFFLAMEDKTRMHGCHIYQYWATWGKTMPTGS